LALRHFRNIGTRFLQQGEGTIHISGDKIIWSMDRAINRTFRCKVHNRPRLILLEQIANQLSISNIAMNKTITLVSGNLLQVVEVAGVSELVEINN